MTGNPSVTTEQWQWLLMFSASRAQTSWTARSDGSARVPCASPLHRDGYSEIHEMLFHFSGTKSQFASQSGREHSSMRWRSLVLRQGKDLGERDFHFMRASSIRNCQSTPRCWLLLATCQAVVSLRRVSRSPIRRPVRP